MLLLRMHPQGAYVKPPPYCSSLQDGGGFLYLRFFDRCGSALGSAFGADA
ncbi:hypothetical protein HMPREF0742_00342 [Rothia aeria F0184]|uniref:Uncharacterized protein n=1 Tax=Rothia aeria F0184 TaxID=888019 RepID=U7V6V3_9MICC|nr:hypothetical protein HMPREF0742_00342 [Rothia aeria F0184]